MVHKSDNPEIHVNTIIESDNAEFFENIYPYKTESESTSEKPKRPREESMENILTSKEPCEVLDNENLFLSDQIL